MKRAVYTVLMGDYEGLNELRIDPDPGADYLCFTDDPSLTSETWEIVHVKPALPADPHRSQRVIKIEGCPRLDKYDMTLYIDNTVELRQPGSMILAEWLVDGVDIAGPAHSFRDSVEDEFIAVAEACLDSSERIDEQLNHYRAFYPEVLGQKPQWSGMIARRNTPQNRALCVTWLQHVLRYARRDQLSFNVACTVNGVSVRVIPIDNHESPLHIWPIYNNRRQSMRIYPAPPRDELVTGVSQGVVKIERSH